MKAALIAITAAAALSAAAPAFAASDAPRDRYQSQEQTFHYSGLSEHCQQVLSRPDMWGDREVTFCQNSI